ncbi:hypothetical protein PPSIR1_02496 [Plesiocystis pacifica SIR-1]|uniref:FIST domain-containing protein n=1 Tax=Plesiocystis pacifica SIR-1 TaxID=391625 RepID=A6G463_9BACT|nr:FIST N-terminal domain-containing protein [Plesiocystis pacifica]EDM79386.1 hypothetical protein PPSIR1_02496 [Plesiocystis pacifica SIR-1]
MASGWSELADTAAASEQALAKVGADVPEPRFVLVFFTEPHSPDAIHDAVRSRHPDAQIFGMQSANAVFTSEGIHGLEGGAIAMLGFAAEDLRVGIAGAPLLDGDNLEHRALGRELYTLALASAGQRPDSTPTAMITSQAMGHSEQYCEALNESLSIPVPMIGGNAVTSTITHGAVIANDEVYAEGVGLAVLFSETKVGTHFHGGFSGRMKRGVVTGVAPDDDHVITTIDGRPALEVYDEWSEGAFREQVEASRSAPVIVNESVLQPLAKALDTKSGEPHFVTLHPWRFNPDGSLDGGVSVTKGETLHYVEGSDEALIQRSGVVTRRAMAEARIPRPQLAGGVHIYCIGAGMALGIGADGKAGGIVDAINTQTDGAPYIGGFFGGEQGMIPDHGYFAGNLMSSMMVFSR